MSDRPLDLVVRGGTIVTAEGRQRADLGVSGGRVAQIGGEMTAAREIEAGGRFVLPGGVDPHVHLHVEPIDDDPDWVDDYTSGSEAALAGGITTVGNMSYVLPGETISHRVRAESALVAEQAIADVFFHAVVLAPTDEVCAEVASVVAAGQSSVKIFMCFPAFDASREAFARVMRAASGAGGLTLIHCEDFATIACCTADLSARARTTMAHFAESRPVAAETIAVERAIAMCRETGAPTYIVHVSSAAALAATAAARAEGLPLFVETRPLYLYLTEERYGQPDGGIYVAQPPLRGEGDLQALWRGIVDGGVDVLASDHAPWTRALKLDPKVDLEHPRPGVAELDTMLPLFFTEAVGKERITLERFVALTATNAARLCGLYPRKGTIAVGSDADLVIWETRARRVVRDEDLYSRAGHSVYAGRELSAWPATTIRRGEVVFDDGRIVGKPGSGQVVPRGGTQSLP
jgi:dihydropyrimidinase